MMLALEAVPVAVEAGVMLPTIGLVGKPPNFAQSTPALTSNVAWALPLIMMGTETGSTLLTEPSLFRVALYSVRLKVARSA